MQPRHPITMVIVPTAMSRLAADREGRDDDSVAKLPWVTESQTPTPRIPQPPNCRGDKVFSLTTSQPISFQHTFGSKAEKKIIVGKKIQHFLKFDLRQEHKTTCFLATHIKGDILHMKKMKPLSCFNYSSYFFQRACGGKETHLCLVDLRILAPASWG